MSQSMSMEHLIHVCKLTSTSNAGLVERSPAFIALGALVVAVRKASEPFLHDIFEQVRRSRSWLLCLSNGHSHILPLLQIRDGILIPPKSKRVFCTHSMTCCALVASGLGESVRDYVEPLLGMNSVCVSCFHCLSARPLIFFFSQLLTFVDM